ncbi:MAG TPA: imidazolonepropionase [Bryobacteraceae bacterium]|nr:imidazolonepropionase [Bryobacteraceae bacterium]
MSDALLIRNAGQLLTLRGPQAPRRGDSLGDLGLIRDGAVLIRNGSIEAAGPAAEVEQQASEEHDVTEIDARGCVVMPGFVDSHTHLVHGPPRLLDYEMRLRGADYHEISEAGGGILASVKAVRAAAPQDLEAQARSAVRNFVRHGTTTIEAKSGYGLDETAEFKTLVVVAAIDGQPVDVVATYLGAHIIPAEYKGNADAYIQWMCEEMMPRIRRQRLATFADVYCDRGAFTIDQARQYLTWAREQGLELKVHAEQFEHTGAVRMACELSATSADHLEQADADDAAALGHSSTIATLLPGSVFHLGLDRYAPARLLIENGAAVALATDFNPGTSPTCNMSLVLSLACTHMGMSPAEAISAATINGAHAVGRAESIGSLEPGKQADMILLNANDYREIPYWFGVNLVDLTIKRGVVIYRQGEVMETVARERAADAR